MKDLVRVSIVSSAAFIGCIAIGFLIYLKRFVLRPSAKRIDNNFISETNVALGAVLIAVSFHHILCEGLIKLHYLFEDSIDSLRLAKLCTIVFIFGFFFMLFIEKMCIRHRHDEYIEEKIQPKGYAERETQQFIDNSNKKTDTNEEESDDSLFATRDRADSVVFRPATQDSIELGSLIHRTQTDIEDEALINTIIDSIDDDERGYDEKKLRGYLKSKQKSQLFTLSLVFLSLCLHSLVSGFSASFAGHSNNPKSLAFLIISFVLHKTFDVAIVAKYMIDLQTRRIVYALLISTFAFMTPIGLMLGLYIREKRLDPRPLAFLYFIQLFTGGIFFYIAIVKIVFEHFIEKPRRYRKLFIFILFYFIMSMVSYID